MADSPSADLFQQDAPATDAVQSKTAGSQAPLGLLDFRTPDEDQIQSTTAQSEYCTRAIDIDGLFCYIGCSEGCRCDVETFFSQCCCSLE